MELDHSTIFCGGNMHSKWAMCDYRYTARDFVGHNGLDPVMHGGCSGCVCSCRKVLVKLSAFGKDAIMNKPVYETLEITAAAVVAAGDYSTLSPEVVLTLADRLEGGGAVCSTGTTDWDTPNIVLSDDVDKVLEVVDTFGLSISPLMRRELEVAAESSGDCASKWTIGVRLRPFLFQVTKNSLYYTTMSGATIHTLPHFPDCRPMLQVPLDIPLCSTGDVCFHNLYNTMNERYADSVALSVLPAIVTAQILIMGNTNLLYRRDSISSRLQYYFGLSTGTLSPASVVNLTLSYVTFTYSFVNLIKARTGEQLLNRDFRVLWDIVQQTATVSMAAVLFSLQLTSLAFIGTYNGTLLRKSSEMGAKYCGLKDSCYVFTVNIVFVVATAGAATSATVHAFAFILKVFPTGGLHSFQCIPQNKNYSSTRYYDINTAKAATHVV
ncbi:hypothetical protein ON010_g13983 [Phytophthora cinnamomi]|nr:hypothetical protein ON010_g13983 [Phytophthora cinnamomi]